MADLMSADGSERSRGQMLLVAVLVLAAAFIVLALVVNSAIFTENLATQDDVAGAEEAIEERAAVEDNLEKIFREANSEYHTTLSIQEAISDGIEEYEGLERFPQTARSQIVDVEYIDYIEEGVIIAQDNSERNFTNLAENDESDWTVAQNVDASRDITFTFTQIDTSGFLGSDSPFRMNIDNGEWMIEFSSEDDIIGGVLGPDEVALRVTNDDGIQESCIGPEPEPGDPLEVDVTAGTMNGELCEALDRLQGDGSPLSYAAQVDTPYQIRFENPDTVEGTYSMVVDGTAHDDLGTTEPDDEDPYAVDAIYDIEVSYSYHTHNVAYETDFRVAPGEVQTDD